jgi:hypothetical protein
MPFVVRNLLTYLQKHTFSLPEGLIQSQKLFPDGD